MSERKRHDPEELEVIDLAIKIAHSLAVGKGIVSAWSFTNDPRAGNSQEWRVTGPDLDSEFVITRILK